MTNSLDCWLFNEDQWSFPVSSISETQCSFFIPPFSKNHLEKVWSLMTRRKAGSVAPIRAAQQQHTRHHCQAAVRMLLICCILAVGTVEDQKFEVGCSFLSWRYRSSSSNDGRQSEIKTVTDKCRLPEAPKKVEDSRKLWGVNDKLQSQCIVDCPLPKKKKWGPMTKAIWWGLKE